MKYNIINMVAKNLQNKVCGCTYLELFKVKTIAPLYKVLFKRLMRQKFPCCLEQNFHLTHVNKPLPLYNTN